MHERLTWIALSGRTEDPSLPFIETMMETHMILTFLFRAASSPDCCGRRYWAEMRTTVRLVHNSWRPCCCSYFPRRAMV